MRVNEKYPKEIGLRFNKLITLQFEQRNYNQQKVWFALVRCDCGNEKWVRFYHLYNGKTKSCGCLRKGRKQGKGEKTLEIMQYAQNNIEASLSEIAKKYDVTKQYVHQLLRSEFGSEYLLFRKKSRSLDHNLLVELAELRAQKLPPIAVRVKPNACGSTRTPKNAMGC